MTPSSVVVIGAGTMGAGIAEVFGVIVVAVVFVFVRFGITGGTRGAHARDDVFKAGGDEHEFFAALRLQGTLHQMRGPGRHLDTRGDGRPGRKLPGLARDQLIHQGVIGELEGTVKRRSHHRRQARHPAEPYPAEDVR